MYNIDTCHAIWCQPHPGAHIIDIINQMLEISAYHRIKAVALFNGTLLDVNPHDNYDIVNRRWHSRRGDY